MSRLIVEAYKRFEDIKQIREDGSEYWSARAPSCSFGLYSVVKCAMIVCENSGHNSASDFVEVSKIVEAGAASKPILDYELSRYACLSDRSKW